MKRGPYIFASCHEDVFEYQPQFVCVCKPGSAPYLLKNPNEVQPTTLQAKIEGITEPIGHSLVGHWLPNRKSMKPFLIVHKGSVTKPNCLKLNFELGEKIDTLAPDKDGSYTGKVSGHGTGGKKFSGQKMRFTSLGSKQLEIQLKDSTYAYSTWLTATWLFERQDF